MRAAHPVRPRWMREALRRLHPVTRRGRRRNSTALARGGLSSHERNGPASTPPTSRRANSAAGRRSCARPMASYSYRRTQNVVRVVIDHRSKTDLSQYDTRAPWTHRRARPGGEEELHPPACRRAARSAGGEPGAGVRTGQHRQPGWADDRPGTGCDRADPVRTETPSCPTHRAPCSPPHASPPPRQPRPSPRV